MVLEKQEVKGKLKNRKEGEQGELQAGAVFQLQVFQQPEWSGWSLWNCLLGTEELTEQVQAEPIWTEQVQLVPVQIRQPLTETTVLERKMITDASGIVEAVGLPVSYLAADGTRKQYRYELPEITAPDGYVCSEQV